MHGTALVVVVLSLAPLGSTVFAEPAKATAGPAPGAPGTGRGSAAAAGAEDIPEATEVTPLQPGPEKPVRPPGLRQMVGRVHPLLVHFPIAWMLLLVLVDGVTFFLHRPGWSRAGLLILLAAVVSMV